MVARCFANAQHDTFKDFFTDLGRSFISTIAPEIQIELPYVSTTFWNYANSSVIINGKLPSYFVL
jgi:hypothetical protein